MLNSKNASFASRERPAIPHRHSAAFTSEVDNADTMLKSGGYPLCSLHSEWNGSSAKW